MKASTSKKIKTLEELEVLSRKLKKEIEGKTVISVCSGTGCRAYNSQDIYREIEREISKREKDSPDKVKNIVLKRTGCHGFCEKGPIIVIYPEETCYLKSKIEDVPEIVERTLNNEIVERLLYANEDGTTIRKESEIPFYK